MKSLRDYDEHDLRHELDRRERMKKLGLCWYCEYNGDAGFCANKEAHLRARYNSEYASMLHRLNLR